MSKSVTYSVVPRKNLLKKDEPAKYYAQAQASGDVEVKEMAKRIEKACTVTRADVMAVLIALEDTIVEGLERGEIVRLGEIGSFQIGLRGKGAVSEEEYSASHPESESEFSSRSGFDRSLVRAEFCQSGQIAVEKERRRRQRWRWGRRGSGSINNYSMCQYVNVPIRECD